MAVNQEWSKNLDFPGSWEDNLLWTLRRKCPCPAHEDSPEIGGGNDLDFAQDLGTPDDWDKALLKVLRLRECGDCYDCPSEAECVIELSVDDAESDDYEYELGETVYLTISVSIADCKDGEYKLYSYNTEDQWTIIVSDGGTSDTFPATYKVTENDIVNGEIEFPVVLRSLHLEEPIEASDTVLTEASAPSLSITKTTTTSKEEYALGDTIAYQIDIENTGNRTLSNVVIEDLLTSDQWTISTLPLAGTETFTASYEVTEQDILEGSVTNTATVTADTPDPETPQITDEAEVDETTEEPNPELTLTVTETSTPENTNGYVEDEYVYCTASVENTGNLTITNISVTIEATGDTYTISSLAPDKTEEFAQRYKVKAADCTEGSVTITATATGEAPADETLTVVDGTLEVTCLEATE